MLFLKHLSNKRHCIGKILPSAGALHFQGPGTYCGIFKFTKASLQPLTCPGKSRSIFTTILYGTHYSEKKTSHFAGESVSKGQKMENLEELLSEKLPPDKIAENMAEATLKDAENSRPNENSKEDPAIQKSEETSAQEPASKSTPTLDKEGGSSESNNSAASDRPNHFLAIQISDAQISQAIQEIQEHVIAQEPRLSSSAIKVASLHLTLLAFRCTSKEEINAVMDAMEEGFPPDLRRSLHLKFSGLDHFRNQVLFAKLTEGTDGLQLIFESLLKSFDSHGIPLPKIRQTFTPHLTIFKTKQAKKLRKMGLKKIEPGLYEKFADSLLGSQHAHTLQLCSMTGPKDLNGYYPCLLELSFDDHLTSVHHKAKEEIRNTISSLVSSNLA